jgi:predicted metallopeptidase
MTLKLHPEMIAAGYDYLCQTEPFCYWKLPESDEIGFSVVRDPKIFADFLVQNGTPVIRVSAVRNGHTDTLMATIAHEMIHLYQELTGDRETHGPRFRKMAAKVCKAHGFDPAAF